MAGWDMKVEGRRLSHVRKRTSLDSQHESNISTIVITREYTVRRIIVFSNAENPYLKRKRKVDDKVERAWFQSTMTVIRALFSKRTLALASGGTLLAAGGGYWYLNSGPAYPLSTKETRRPPPPWTPPSRAEMLMALKQGVRAKNLQAANNEEEEEFDLLIVGGGATGAGVAVDAASRGLKVALVERDDFSAGVLYIYFMNLGL